VKQYLYIYVSGTSVSETTDWRLLEDYQN